MKTIVLEGMLHKFNNLEQATSNWDKDRLPYEVETRVCVIEAHQSLRFDEKIYTHLTDEEFVSIAEENGTVYSIKGFQDAYNNDDINPAVQVIRFINVTI